MVSVSCRYLLGMTLLVSYAGIFPNDLGPYIFELVENVEKLISYLARLLVRLVVTHLDSVLFGSCKYIAITFIARCVLVTLLVTLRILADMAWSV